MHKDLLSRLTVGHLAEPLIFLCIVTVGQGEHPTFLESGESFFQLLLTMRKHDDVIDIVHGQLATRRCRAILSDEARVLAR